MNCGEPASHHTHQSVARCAAPSIRGSLLGTVLLHRCAWSDLTPGSITISSMRRHPLRRLLLPGTVLLLSYVSLFVIHLRNSLAPLGAELVPPDLGYSAAANPTLQLLQMICLASFFTVYGTTLWNWHRLDASPRTLAWSAALAGVLAWSLLPADSSDVLEYIGFGRLAAVYHVSPYLHTYSEFTDRIAPYVTWDDPMPYGPVVLPVFALAGLVSQHHVFVAMYLIKFAWLLIHFLNAGLIYQIAKSTAADPRYALFVFAFNPLILLEELANGHNDGPLILFGLLAVLAVQRGRGGLAIVLALLSALVKTSGLFWVAGIVVLLIQQRRWRASDSGNHVERRGAGRGVLGIPRLCDAARRDEYTVAIRRRFPSRGAHRRIGNAARDVEPHVGV